MSKHDRLNIANEFIEVIASCGRKFFDKDGYTSHFYFNDKGRLIYVDEHTKRHFQTQTSGFNRTPFYNKKDFSHGGTLASLLENVRDYIISGKKLWADYFQPALPNGLKNPWGYGDDILVVKSKGKELGILE